MTGDRTAGGAPDRQELELELRKLRGRTFGEIPSRDIRKRYPLLARLADESSVASVGGDRIRGLLLAAVDGLNAVVLREAAMALFGLSASTYAKPRDVRHHAAMACFDPMPGASTFRQQPQYLKLILAELTDVLLAESSGRKAKPVCSDGHRRSGVRRLGLEARILAALQRQSRPLTLWGEGGNGKTYMARNIAAKIAEEVPVELPVAVIRRGNATRTDEQTYQADLIECLRSVGQASQAWSLAAQELAVRDLIGAPRCFAAIVLDDVDQSTIDRLIPSTCFSPVLITSRTKPATGWPEIRVDAYENVEALAAIQQILGNSDEEKLSDLCRILGNRPVAIDISARMVNAGYATLDGLMSALADDAPGTLESSYELVGENVEKSIVRLYAQVHDRLQSRPAAASVIDVLLWLTSGTVEKFMLDGFLAKKLQSHGERIAHTAALAWLTNIGLARMERNTIEINGLSQTLLRWLEYDRIDYVGANFFETLLTADHPFRPDSSPLEPWYEELQRRDASAAATLQALGATLWVTMNMLTDLLGGDNFVLFCGGPHDWLIKENGLGLYFDKSEKDKYGIVHVTDRAITLWTASGPPRRLTKKQALFMVYTTHLCVTVIDSDMEHVLDPEVPGPMGSDLMRRFEWFEWFNHSDDAGESVHIPVEPYSNDFTATGGLVSWSLCGQRFTKINEKEEGEACPECRTSQNSSERLSNLEQLVDGILAVLDAGSRLHSDEGAYWFAARGRIQQLMGDIQDRARRDADYLSAAQSYLASFASMVNSTESRGAWRLELGYGIVEHLARLPWSATRIRAVPICRWLIASAESIGVPDLDFIYRCSRLFTTSGYLEEALEGYDRCLTLLQGRRSLNGSLDAEKVRRERTGIAERLGRAHLISSAQIIGVRRLELESAVSHRPINRRANFIEVGLNTIYQKQETFLQEIVLKEKGGISYFVVTGRRQQVISVFHAAKKPARGEGQYILPHEVLWAVLKETGIDLACVALAAAVDGTLVLSNKQTVDIDPADAVIMALWCSAPILVISDTSDRISVISALIQSAYPRVRGQDSSIAAQDDGDHDAARSDLSNMRRLVLWTAGTGLLPSRRPFVAMKEEHNDIWLSIPVALPEVIAIDSWQHRSTRSGRNTHDMICEVFRAADIQLETCRIVKNGPKAACFIEFSGGKSIRARVGDGIALALRMEASILVDAALLQELGAAADKFCYPTVLRWA